MDDRSLGVSRDPMRRNAAALVFLAVLLAIVGFAIGRLTAPKESHSTPSPLPSSMGDRYPHTRLGAVAAATGFGQALAGSMESATDYRDDLVALAAPGWQQSAEELADNTLDFVHSRYGVDGDLMFMPVRYRVASYTDSEAVIQVWGATIASGSKVPGLEESWVLGTIRLDWIQGTWLVAGQESEAGPTPEVLGATNGVSYETVLEGFKEYRHGPDS